MYDQKWGRVYRQEGSNAPGVVGRAFHSGRRAVEPTDGPGIRTYGPYLTLAPGRYRVTVWYAASGDDGSGYLDIIGTLKGVAGTTLFKQSLGSGNDLEMRTTVTIAPGGVIHFEVRSWFSGHGMLLVKNMEIAPVDG
ncbi:hypothetical protein OVY01_10010 [Robbsia sp. Bb-Pol-6]|uniref:Uncharacterized protein n=1 Tax=Robbsia betulipollinis TaxID=2981849 RepID=A0ABT3ZMC1_9BURK|nr:hypothetical protein [Robbsia betulipollinis]MCY0387562.1 hypothetical protein [Robbsia betulipollinis]